MADFTLDPNDRGTSRFTARLARHPHVVVAFTFIIAVVVTVAVLLIAHDMSPSGVVAMLATVWGLDLALVIYLVTARDTDTLLARIDALQDQLSAALAAPGADAEIVQAESPDTDGSSAATDPGETLEPVTAVDHVEPVDRPDPAVRVEDGPSSDESGQQVLPATTADLSRVTQGSRPSFGHEADQRRGAAPGRPGPERRFGPPAQWFAQHVPGEYLDALQQQTGIAAEDILRAWTPNPYGAGPWVIETKDGRRWSVFQRGGTRPTVISLDQLRQGRDQLRRGRAQNQARVQASRQAHDQAQREARRRPPSQ